MALIDMLNGRPIAWLVIVSVGIRHILCGSGGVIRVHSLVPFCRTGIPGVAAVHNN